MLDVHFYTKDGSHVGIDLSDSLYEKIAKSKITSMNYVEREIIVEEEEHIVYATELRYDTRQYMINSLEELLLDEINSMNIDNEPNIKEVRDVLFDIRTLAKIIEAMKDENNILFSYE